MKHASISILIVQTLKLRDRAIAYCFTSILLDAIASHIDAILANCLWVSAECMPSSTKGLLMAIHCSASCTEQHVRTSRQYKSAALLLATQF
jgi:hypothetical protein